TQNPRREASARLISATESRAARRAWLSSSSDSKSSRVQPRCVWLTDPPLGSLFPQTLLSGADGKQVFQRWKNAPFRLSRRLGRKVAGRAYRSPPPLP